MKCTGKFAAPRIDLDGYRAVLDKAMRETLAQALVEWLTRVLEEIPSWSGASRATFALLADTIGMSVPNAPATNSRIGQGMSESIGSKLSVNEPAGHYTFTYQTTLPWLIWNEYNDANVDPDPTKWPPPAVLKKPGPYEFQAKGLVAFLHFADGVRLPSVKPFIKAKTIKAG
jgi:hypothetical protein